MRKILTYTITVSVDDDVNKHQVGNLLDHMVNKRISPDQLMVDVIERVDEACSSHHVPRAKTHVMIVSNTHRAGTDEEVQAALRQGAVRRKFDSHEKMYAIAEKYGARKEPDGSCIRYYVPERHSQGFRVEACKVLTTVMTVPCSDNDEVCFATYR